ncbi:MAG: O-methyltransferase [Chloroflexota bacterium]
MRSDGSWFPGEADSVWIESLAQPLHPAFEAIEAAAAPTGVPILDRDAGRVLGVLASDRRRICEVGTAIGYSTLWMALAQPADGTIVTIDPNAERTRDAREHWRTADVPDNRIIVVNAPALDAFAAANPALAGPFDMVFIDALKGEYAGYLEALTPRLEPGALVVADNVLWGGRTSGVRPAVAGDGTAELRTFCEWVLGDRRFSGTIVPIGDGLLVATWRP